jgi:hypothetical protein
VGDTGAIDDDIRIALAQLEPLVGRWRTRGSVRALHGQPAAGIDAIDTYERVAGGALLHLVDAQVGDQHVEGAELIGYRADLGRYATQYFGDDGPTAYEAELSEADGRLTWRMRSERTRFTGTFSDDGNVITGFWELLEEDDAGWQRWMDITLTKQPG